MREFNYAIAIVYVLCEKIKGKEEKIKMLGVLDFHSARQHFYKPENFDEII